MASGFLKIGKKIAGYILTDKAYVKLNYLIDAKEKLNLSNPVSYTQKLQYLKLYCHNPLYTTLVDKLSVKEYVAEKIGSEHIIPLLGVWNSGDEIDFDSLPNQFVLKVSHDSGGIIICKNKSELDIAQTRKRIDSLLKYNYYKYSREWPYKNVPRKVIAEKYMCSENEESLSDYKFFCFNGKPEFLYVSKYEHTEDEELSFVTMDWEIAPFQRADHKLLSELPAKPVCFDEMVEIAKKLSENIPFVRVDLYQINGTVFFGEMSFFPTGGVSKFYPEKYNDLIGDLIILPKRKKYDDKRETD